MAEAALMALRIHKNRNKIILANDIHPDYVAVLNTYIGNCDGVTVETGSADEDTACVIVQSPDFYGNIRRYETLRNQCNETGALLVVVVNEFLSLGLLPPPVEADIVCGEAQSIGVGLSYGGPYLGFFACREAYLRQMPGRLCGMTKDADGKRGFVLTLSTREQHIRRAKATSNICTNQGLCALAFTVHMTLLGEDGYKNLARLNHEAACRTADALSDIEGVTVLNDTFFNEFTIAIPQDANMTVQALADRGIIAGYASGKNKIIVAATEMTTDQDIKTLVCVLKEILG